MTSTARKPRKGTKLDADQIRQAAAGRWPEILQHVGGLDPTTLDGQHHPCPKCGGDDRFRLIDEAAGAVLCNQCFATKNGDGFAAIGWSLGVKFGEALKRVAEYLGIAAAKGDVDPAKDLKWMEWSSDLAQWYLRAKGPTTEAVLLADGCRMARYKDRFTVIAWPIIGESLDTSKPVGWVICKHDGGMLPKWDKDGNVTGQTKYKITYGSKPGLVGVHAIKRLQAPGLVELVWKCEGISDLGAVRAAIPGHLADRHVALTNSSGARETPRWPATALARQSLNILHDADQPGQDGAAKWARDVAAQAAEGIQVRNVQLPYGIEETHGKDSRDYLKEGRTYADLLSLADQAAPVIVARTESGEVDYATHRNPVYDRLLKKLQLEVLYEEEGGAIRVFSTLLRKSSTVRDVTKLKQDTLIQICGQPAIEFIVASAGDADHTSDLFSMADVRRALAYTASGMRGKNDERGVGVWQGLDLQGNETETVVLVGNAEGARYNGDKILRRIIAPRADGLVLDFGASGKDWYHFDELAKLLASADDVAWRQATVDEAEALFGRWRWKNPGVDPTLVAGLVAATWIQTIWDWRPLVAISGESNAGKSLLFECLGGNQSRRGIFGGLAFKQAKSTAAGILQGLSNTARVALCDEFEASKERTKILEALRQSTRGETTAKGTSHHRSVEFVLRHIGWVAAIETGLQKQPDANRFVQLELLTAAPGQHGKLKLPAPQELADLGQRLLAVAIRSAIQAKRLAVLLKDTPAPGIDPRTVESYAVPAAMLTVATSEREGEDRVEEARTMLLALLGNVDAAEQGRVDQRELLDDILAASILVSPSVGVKMISQILESPALRVENHQRLEAEGLKLLDDGSLFIAPKLVSSRLLRGGAWEGQKIDQLLLRLPGAERRPLKIGGRATRGLIIPQAVINIGTAAGEQEVAF